MANVYILYSKKLNKFYTGSCLDFEKRLTDHLAKKFIDGFSAKTNDWELFYIIKDLTYKQAREIEAHIKRMKSKKYIEELKKYSEISEKLIEKYK
jgi:putative endonuclease